VTIGDGLTALATDGAPSDCVALALLGILSEPVNLVVSGINPNANLGHDVTYSGTVTAAMEAVIGGVPGLAISLNSPEDHAGMLDYGTPARLAGRIVAKVIDNGLPPGILLNVNVPYLPDEQIKGFQITRQGLRVYRDSLERRLDPRGKPYYWIGGEAPTGISEKGTDFGALAEGYVSVTPLHLDLTAHQHLADFKSWDFLSN
jgi:5'-nucleotidase